MVENRRILIWGGKSQAKLLEGLILDLGLGEICAVFDSHLNTQFYKSKGRFISDIFELKRSLGEITHFVIAVGSEYGFARHQISKALISLNKKPLSVIHHSAIIEEESSIGSGAQIMANVVVNKYAKIGDQVILNTSSVVDHEANIGDGVHIMGGASVTGGVIIEKYCTIGTNATVLPHIRVGEGSMIGAGSVVIKDVLPNSLLVGVPAKYITEQKHVFNAKEIDGLIKG